MGDGTIAMSTRYDSFDFFVSIGYGFMLIVALLLRVTSPLFYLTFSILWIVLYFIGKRIVKKISDRKQAQLELQWQEKLANFKENAEVLIVDLNKCDIKSNQYVLEIDGHINGELPEAFIDLPSVAYKNVRKVNVDQSIIVYKHNTNEVFKSRVLPIGKESLLFLLDAQKVTKLYVDKADRTKYYFDLDFLNS